MLLQQCIRIRFSVYNEQIFQTWTFRSHSRPGFSDKVLFSEVKVSTTPLTISLKEPCSTAGRYVNSENNFGNSSKVLHQMEDRCFSAFAWRKMLNYFHTNLLAGIQRRMQNSLKVTETDGLYAVPSCLKGTTTQKIEEQHSFDILSHRSTRRRVGREECFLLYSSA